IIERTPARIDLNVAPFRPSQLLQSLTESGQVVMKFRVVLGMRHQNADPPFSLDLLRTRRERRCGGRTAEQRDEVAAIHSITSLAMACNVKGTVSPSAFAVFRLMTNSNLVGACTGRSPAFSPLRMRSAYEAARRKLSDKSTP